MGACRIIISPITKEEITSKTWNDLYNLVNNETRADELYKQLASPQFIQFYGDWINDPNTPNTNDIGEPILEGELFTNGKGETKSVFNRGSFLTANNDIGIDPRIVDKEDAGIEESGVYMFTDVEQGFTPELKIVAKDLQEQLDNIIKNKDEIIKFLKDNGFGDSELYLVGGRSKNKQLSKDSDLDILIKVEKTPFENAPVIDQADNRIHWMEKINNLIHKNGKDIHVIEHFYKEVPQGKVIGNNLKIDTGFSIGNITAVNDGEYLDVFETTIQGKPNAGTNAYLKLAQWAKDNGLVLRSDSLSAKRISDAAKALWNRFVNTGQAELQGDRYVFTGNPSNVSNNIYYSESDQNNINYSLKAISIITKNLDKVKQWEKQVVNPPVFWTKLQNDLQIPKEQVELLKNSDGNTIEEKLLDFASKYAQVVEINVATELNSMGKYNPITGDYEDTNNPTQIYRNLTAHGSNNESRPYTTGDWEYKELRVQTPGITLDETAQKHTPFNTGHDIAHIRASFNKKTGEVVVHEMQSDPFQDNLKMNHNTELSANNFKKALEQTYNNVSIKKIQENGVDKWQVTGRERKQLVKVDIYNHSKFSKEELQNDEPDDLENKGEKIEQQENQFLQLLNQKDNWVKLISQALIQWVAKQQIEVPTQSVESKVRELEQAGLLKIKCD